LVKIDSFGAVSVSSRLELGDAVAYDGKLYDIAVSKLGDTIEIQPYQGDTGKLKIRVKDGIGRTIEDYRIELRNAARSLSIEGDATGIVIVPPGDYEAKVSINSDKPTSEDFLRLSIRIKEIVSVKQGGFTQVITGGPIKILIAPDATVITAKRSEKRKLPITFSIKTDELSYLTADRRVKITVLSPKGKVMLRDKTELDVEGFCSYMLQIPNNWKPGSYKIVASFDPSPYQKPVEVAKTLKIVK
jgi:hypothetical protein